MNEVLMGRSVDPGGTFAVALQQTGDEIWDALDNSLVSFYELASPLRGVAIHDNSPIPGDGFFRHASPQLLVPGGEGRFGPLAAVRFELPCEEISEDLALYCAETPEGVRCTLKYDTSSFSEEQIARVASWIRESVAAASQESDLTVARLLGS
jgi:hypothetical protein